MDIDTMRICDTSLYFKNNTDRSPHGWGHRQYRHYSYFYKILHRLQREGFTLEKDPDTLKNFPSISKDHWYGKRGELEVYGKKYPNGFKIEFFQNVICENQNGGKYDFQKLQKMPYLIRLQYIKYMGIVIDMLESLVKVEDITKPMGRTAEEKILIDLSLDFHMLPSLDFNLHELDGTKPGVGYGWGNYEYHFEDRDGKPLRNGDFKCFRQHWSGVLMQGRIYYRANQQFWVIINDTEIELAYYNELFDPTPDDLQLRRKAPDRTPEEYKKRKKAIAETNNIELIRELRRRGLKVNVKSIKGLSE